jgi:hypothetical protein
MKKDKKHNRSIGDVINQLSAQPVPITVRVGTEKFDLFVHPATDEELRSYTEMIDPNDKTSLRAGMNYLMCHCIRDGNGNKVWAKPEDITVQGYVRMELQGAINQHVFGFTVSEFAAKN